MEAGTDEATDLAAENARLRERVAELERELAEQAGRTNAIVARTQERVYWLDRWHLDLNALMARPGAAEARALVRALRRPYRWLKLRKRRHFS
jgi:cell division septum initiation protein DivIVA